jgi:hypothetical protein
MDPPPPIETAEVAINCKWISLQRERLNKWGKRWGRYFGDFTYLLFTLCSYLLVSILTWGLLSRNLGTPWGRAGTIAYDVATGTSPTNYSSEIKQSFPWLWIWLGFFHILAWLIVPVLAATTIDVLYRLHDEEKGRTEKRLRRRIRKFAQANNQLTGVHLEQFVDNTLEHIETAFKTAVKKRE